MSSFQVTSSKVVPLLGGDNLHTQARGEMLQKIWTISSETQVQALHVNVPGAVFVDFDASVGSSSGLATTGAVIGSTSDEDIPVVALGKVVAQIVVTSDCAEILDSLEVAPQSGQSGDQGVKFAVKNQDAKLKGSMLTQVFLAEKNTLREFQTRSAQTVVGESVLVQDDADAHVSIEVHDAGVLHVASTRGFSLREFDVTSQTAGIAQVQVPFIRVQDCLGLLAGARRSATVVSATTISAPEVHSGVVALSYIEVQTSNLTAKSMISMIGLGGSVRVLGDGKVDMQAGKVAVVGEITTGDIVSEKASVSFGFTGRALIQTDRLHVLSPFFGTVEYTNATEPELVTPIKNWLWKSRADIVRPAPNDWAKKMPKPYKFLDPPLRQPMAVNHRVKVSDRREPKLTRAGEYSWTTIGLTTGAIAVGAFSIIAMRQRTSRLAKVL